MNRPPKPEGMPWIVPYLTVPDPAVAIDFYHRAFAFQVTVKVPGPKGRIDHAEMSWQDGRIMIGPEIDEHTARAPMTTGVPSPVGLYIYVDRLVERYELALSEGAETIEEPAVTFWGDRIYVVADPFGYKWTFAQNVADHDPNILAR